MSAFAIFHTAVSLLAIASGGVVAYGLITGQGYARATLAYLITTIVTLRTGFIFPYHGFTAAIGVGILCVLIVIPIVVARHCDLSVRRLHPARAAS